MKRKTALLGLILIAYMSVFAQYEPQSNQGYGQRPRKRQELAPLPQGEPKGFLSVNYGLAVPVGNFGLNFGNYGQYALPGTSSALLAGIPLKGTNIGVSVALGQYSNSFDNQTFSLNQANIAGAPSYSNIYNESYSVTSLLVGGFYTWPMGRFSFDGRAMVGALFCYLPDVQYGLGDGVGNLTDLYEYQNSFKVLAGADLGIGLRFSLRRSTSLSLSVDYATAFGGNYSTIEQHTQYSTTTPGLATGISNAPVAGAFNWSVVSYAIGIGFEFPSLR